jgi:hypothetical protein
MLATFMPYQLILGFSAVRAVYRELQREHGWEKTDHVGAHRASVAAAEPIPVQRPRVHLPQQRLIMRALRRVREGVSPVLRSGAQLVHRGTPKAVATTRTPDVSAMVMRAPIRYADVIRATVHSTATALPPEPASIGQADGSAIGQRVCPGCSSKSLGPARFCRRCGAAMTAALVGPVIDATRAPDGFMRSAMLRRPYRLVIASLVLVLVSTFSLFEIILAQVDRPDSGASPGVESGPALDAERSAQSGQ